MAKRILAALVLALLGAASTSAQFAIGSVTTVYGQIFLPNGSPLENNLRFYFTSDDGMINDYRFTDSHGRFVLERLNNLISYTITVTGDGTSYGDTVYRLPPLAGRVTRVVVTLNSPPRKYVAPGGTLSVASVYRPAARVAGLYDRAMKEVEQGRVEAAEALLREAIKLDPKFFAPRNDLGVLLLLQKKYTEAERMFRQALAVDPKSINALLNLGITLNHLQKYDGAMASLREALRLEPRLVRAHRELGIALLETDQLAEAEQELTRAAKSSGEDEIAAQLYLGKLYARTGDFEKSIAAFHAYLEKAPTSASAAEVRALMARMERELAARRELP